MTTAVRLCTALTLVATLSACAAGGGAKPATTPTARAASDTAKKDVPWKPWAEVTKDTRQLTGLFTAYLNKKDNVYLDLKPGDFDLAQTPREMPCRIGLLPSQNRQVADSDVTICGSGITQCLGDVAACERGDLVERD